MKATLTDISVRALLAPDTGQLTVWDAISPVGVRVSNGGAKTFVMMLGSGRRHTIGHVGIVTLAQAREAARRLKAEMTLGRIMPANVPTAQARKEYLERIDIRPRTREYYERHLGKLTVAKVGDIRPSDINRILDKATRATRNQVLATFRAFFKWCQRRHYIDRSPCDLMQLSPRRDRTRVLSDHELRAIWVATSELDAFCRIVRLLMLTGQRRSETAAIRASWIGDGTVTFPETITKNKHEHVLPVASIAQSLLRSGGADALFVARGTEDTPFNGWSKSKQALDKRLGQSLAYWQLHDLRRTYRTIHARIGTPPHIAERLINHVSSVSEIEKIYDRHTYQPEMRKAVAEYECWFEANIIKRQDEREAA